MLGVPSPPMTTYFSSVFGANAPRFGHLLLEIAMTEFTFRSLVSFICAAEYGADNLFVSTFLRALAKGSRLC